MRQEHKNKETILKNINNFNIFLVIFNRQLGMRMKSSISSAWKEVISDFWLYRIEKILNHKDSTHE